MTNLPNSEQSGDLDNINVTRAQFRAEIGVFLEYVAQALGGVTGNYTVQAVDPLAPVLQGTPEIEPGATPPDADRSDRIPSTRWVQEHGRYVGASAPGTPADGMLWVDTASSPYALKAYNQGDTQWDLLSGVPSGTRMLFQQETAPAGWTKDTTNDNMALRVVSGTPVVVDDQQTFTTVFSSTSVAGTVGDTTLTVNQMPTHAHGISDSGHSHSVSIFDPGHLHGQGMNGGNHEGGGKSGGTQSTTTRSSTGISASANAGITGISVQNNGASSPHDHPFVGTNIDLSINYVDVIVAEKD